MTMVFVNTKDNALNVQKKLTGQNVKAEILIGLMETKDRDRIIDSFRKNEFSALISTNVLARGIDVPEVDLVINYDVPFISSFGFKDPDYANYMHRVGRTGRFGTDGVAITMMSDEHDPELMDLIGKHYEIDIKEIKTFEELQKIIADMRGDIYA